MTMGERRNEAVPAGELVESLALLGLHVDEAALDRMDAAARAAQAAALERAEREARERRMAQLAGFGMPTRDLEAIAITAALEESDAKRAVDRFVERHSSLRKQHVLVLSGEPGTGKTCAAAYWIAQRATKHPYVATRDPVYITAARIARTSAFDDEKLEAIELAEKLVIDDLGAEYADEKGSFASKLDSLMDRRYEHLLPTIITTNLEREKFRARVGKRIASRLEETAHFAVVGGEYRKRAP